MGRIADLVAAAGRVARAEAEVRRTAEKVERLRPIRGDALSDAYDENEAACREREDAVSALVAAAVLEDARFAWRQVAEDAWETRVGPWLAEAWRVNGGPEWLASLSFCEGRLTVRLGPRRPFPNLDAAKGACEGRLRLLMAGEE